jgi:hypothetical protein
MRSEKRAKKLKNENVLLYVSGAGRHYERWESTAD